MSRRPSTRRRDGEEAVSRSSESTYVMVTLNDLAGLPAKVGGSGSRYVLTGRVRKYKTKTSVGYESQIAGREEAEVAEITSLTATGQHREWIDIPRIEYQKKIGGPWEELYVPPSRLPFPQRRAIAAVPSGRSALPPVGAPRYDPVDEIAPHPKVFADVGCGCKSKAPPASVGAAVSDVKSRPPTPHPRRPGPGQGQGVRFAPSSSSSSGKKKLLNISTRGGGSSSNRKR